MVLAIPSQPYLGVGEIDLSKPGFLHKEIINEIWAIHRELTSEDGFTYA